MRRPAPKVVDLVAKHHLMADPTPDQLLRMTPRQLRARRRRRLDSPRQQRRAVHAARLAARNTGH